MQHRLAHARRLRVRGRAVIQIDHFISPAFLRAFYPRRLGEAACASYNSRSAVINIAAAMLWPCAVSDGTA
jgi:hypothetical protein